MPKAVWRLINASSVLLERLLRIMLKRVKKPMPQLEDYAYGMDLDVGKLVYVSPSVRYCGDVRSMMTYEDSKGELHMVRYLVKGECVNSR